MIRFVKHIKKRGALINGRRRPVISMGTYYTWIIVFVPNEHHADLMCLAIFVAYFPLQHDDLTKINIFLCTFYKIVSSTRMSLSAFWVVISDLSFLFFIWFYHHCIWYFKASWNEDHIVCVFQLFNLLLFIV